MRPGPPLYFPPPAPSSTNPPGYTVTLSGDSDRVLAQLRLLPLSRNILSLPALAFHIPATTSRRQSSFRNNRKSTASSVSIERPSILQLKAAVLRLHRDFENRWQVAREFLAKERDVLDGERRVVFLNGGARDVKELCIKAIRDVLGDEEEVESLWDEIMAGGVEGLVDAVEVRTRAPTEVPSLNINVSIPTSMISPISPNVGKREELPEGVVLAFGRSRAATVTRRSTQLEATDEEEEPALRTERLDSTYSSGMESIPTPPASAEIRDAEFRYRSGLSGTERTSLAMSDKLPEELFAGEESNLELHLVPEKPDSRHQLLDRLLPEPIFTASRNSRQLSWNMHPRPLSTIGQIFKLPISATKSPLEVQNEIRLYLTKYLPPVNTAETPTQAEFPEATRWLLDPEVDLFSPLLSSGNEGLPESLCPSLDLITAVGADGRELKDSQISEDTDRQASRLAGTLGSELGNLGNRGAADTRGARISLKFLLRSALPYLPNLPGASLDDIAAGFHLLPALEACIKNTPQIRLLILEFDLRTGSQAVVHLKSILPRSMFRLIVIGEQTPSMQNHGGRIYVRQSIGKTTLSFSSLPSPIAKEPRKHRRFEASRTAAMARADVILSPWTELGAAAYTSTIDLVREGIRARRIECGVIACSIQPQPVYAQSTAPTIRAPRAVSPGAGRSPSPRGTIRNRRESDSRSPPTLHPTESRRPSAATSTSSYDRSERGERDIFLPPHPGKAFSVQPLDREREWADWSSSYFEEAEGISASDDDEEIDEDEMEERERERCRSRLAGRKGSKALRWLGIEST